MLVWSDGGRSDGTRPYCFCRKSSVMRLDQVVDGIISDWSATALESGDHKV